MPDVLYISIIKLVESVPQRRQLNPNSTATAGGDGVIVVRLAVSRERGAVSERFQPKLDAEHGNLQRSLILQLISLTIHLAQQSVSQI